MYLHTILKEAKEKNYVGVTFKNKNYYFDDMQQEFSLEEFSSQEWEPIIRKYFSFHEALHIMEEGKTVTNAEYCEYLYTIKNKELTITRSRDFIHLKELNSKKWYVVEEED